MVFLERSFEKTQIFSVFHLPSLISQNRDQIQGPWFRIIYKRFVGFLQAYFSETIQNFKNRSASVCPFWPCRKVPKIFRLGDYISFENMIFAKIFRVFFRFCVTFPLEPYQTVSKWVPTDARRCLL